MLRGDRFTLVKAWIGGWLSPLGPLGELYLWLLNFIILSYVLIIIWFVRRTIFVYIPRFMFVSMWWRRAAYKRFDVNINEDTWKRAYKRRWKIWFSWKVGKWMIIRKFKLQALIYEREFWFGEQAPEIWPEWLLVDYWHRVKYIYCIRRHLTLRTAQYLRDGIAWSDKFMSTVYYFPVHVKIDILQYDEIVILTCPTQFYGLHLWVGWLVAWYLARWCYRNWAYVYEEWTEEWDLFMIRSRQFAAFWDYIWDSPGYYVGLFSRYESARRRYVCCTTRRVCTRYRLGIQRLIIWCLSESWCVRCCFRCCLTRLSDDWGLRFFVYYCCGGYLLLIRPAARLYVKFYTLPISYQRHL